MQNITIIGTRHQSLGLCNSEALCQILESIQPEVIFEEIPPSYFDQYYITKSKSNLETDAINQYKQKNSVIQVPVDDEDIPDDAFFTAYENLIKRIEGSTSEDSFHYRNLTDAKTSNISVYGFDFLNSKSIIRNDLSIQSHIENFVKKIEDEKLNNVYYSLNSWIDKRENTILNNIYRYCESNNFENAVFTIGSAHLHGLMEKISVMQDSKDNMLKWRFYNF